MEKKKTERKPHDHYAWGCKSAASGILSTGYYFTFAKAIEVDGIREVFAYFAVIGFACAALEFTTYARNERKNK